MFLIKSLITFFLLATVVFAEIPNDDTIKIHAKIYPQLIFFNQSTRPNEHQITIGVVYNNSSSKAIAEKFKQYAHEQYANTIKGKTLNIILISEHEYKSRADEFDGVYFAGINKNFQIKQNNHLTFASSKEQYEANLTLFYIDITNKTNLLLNASILKDGQINLAPTLLKTVKVTTNE